MIKAQLEYYRKCHDYLDRLRANGRTVFLDAAPDLQDKFPDLNDEEAVDVLLDWLKLQK